MKGEKDREGVKAGVGADRAGVGAGRIRELEGTGDAAVEMEGVGKLGGMTAGGAKEDGREDGLSSRSMTPPLKETDS